MITLTDVGRPILIKVGTISWAGDPGQSEVKKKGQLRNSMYLLLSVLDSGWHGNSYFHDPGTLASMPWKADCTLNCELKLSSFHFKVAILITEMGTEIQTGKIRLLKGQRTRLLCFQE